MKKILSLVSVIMVLALSTSLLTACNSIETSTPDEATTTAVIETEPQGETTTVATTTEVATQKPASQSSGNSSAGSYFGGSSGGSSVTPTEKPTNPGINVNGEPVTPTPTRCTITVGNKGYTAEVGETITYVYKLTTPKPIEDIQATTTYDSKMLELLEIDFPLMGDAPIYNPNLYNEMKFNAINLKGFDFTKEADLVTIKFKVIGKGGAAIATAIEVMSEVKTGNAYVSNYAFAEGVKTQEVINK